MFSFCWNLQIIPLTGIFDGPRDLYCDSIYVEAKGRVTNIGSHVQDFLGKNPFFKFYEYSPCIVSFSFGIP